MLGDSKENVSPLNSLFQKMYMQNYSPFNLYLLSHGHAGGSNETHTHTYALNHFNCIVSSFSSLAHLMEMMAAFSVPGPALS